MPPPQYTITSKSGPKVASDWFDWSTPQNRNENEPADTMTGEGGSNNYQGWVIRRVTCSTRNPFTAKSVVVGLYNNRLAALDGVA